MKELKRPQKRNRSQDNLFKKSNVTDQAPEKI